MELTLSEKKKDNNFNNFYSILRISFLIYPNVIYYFYNFFYIFSAIVFERNKIIRFFNFIPETAFLQM